MAQNNKIIITVSGTDKVGIVAKVATILSELNVNIEDIKQTLMPGHFVMFMLCDITNSQNPFKEIKDKLQQEGESFGVEVWVQRKEIFDTMHGIG